ncbi:MAG: MFS transporter [Planctomycetota bacterium]
MRWLRRYAVVTYPFACVPFLFLYFAENGIEPGQYGEILTAYYATMFVAEVPTGMLADRIGAGRMLVMGPLMLALGFGTMLLQPDYAGFLTGEILLGLGHSILSGPPTVALYETLRASGTETTYLREEARMHALRLYGTGTAFLLGGLLVRFGDADGQAFALAIAATCGLCVLAAAFASRLQPLAGLPERRAHRDNAAGLTAKPKPRLLDGAARELRRPGVLWLLGYWLVLFTLLRFPFHDYQPYLDAAGQFEPLFADAIWVGVLFASLSLAAAPFSSKVPALVARFGRRALFWAMPLVMCASLLVMATTISYARAETATGSSAAAALCWLGVAMFFVQQIPFALHWSLVHEFVNHRIGSAQRTTVLSVLSLSARAVYALANVLLFRLQDEHGIPTALATAALCGAALAALVMLLRPKGLLRGGRAI